MIYAMNITEHARETPVVARYDVVVVGGGVAGVAAAIAARRCGASVCLLEKLAAVGGLATIGNVTVYLPICDGNGRQVIGGLGEGFLHLSVADLRACDVPLHFLLPPGCWAEGGDLEQRREHRFKAKFNPDSFMLAMEQQLIDAGATIWYDTHFSGVVREGGRVSHVMVENKSGRLAIAAGTVIDATGDADVCHAAGECTESCDSNSLAGWYFYVQDGRAKLQPMARKYSPDCEREGGTPPFFRGDVGRDVTQHILRTRQMIREQIAKKRAEAPDAAIYPLRVPHMACFRTTRRLCGRFDLTAAHDHGWFDDCIGMTGHWRRPGPIYPIPLQSLQAVENMNLLAAGRCISADKTLWDVTRAIPPCVVTGEAAGAAAAMAVRDADGDVTRVDCAKLQDHLRSHDVIIDPAEMQAL